MHLVSDIVQVLAIVLALLLAAIGLLSIIRSTPVRLVIAPGNGEEPPCVGDALFAKTMELYTGTSLSENQVELLLNGEATCPSLWKDISEAKHSVTVQLYYAVPGVMADTMYRYLAERVKAGVSVHVLLDAFGASGLRKTDFVLALRKAGVRVAWLRPLRWYLLDRIDTRSHVRLVVVDGRIGYTGGFGLADDWLGDGRHEGQWRDTNVRFEGPAVAALQAAFIAGWAEATGVLLTGPRFIPPAVFRPVGSVTAGVMTMAPGVGSTTAERYLALSIAGARKTLYINNSYFIPSPDFRQLLRDAVSRGVDVRVLTANKRSDVKATWFAGREAYEELMRGGVRIYEYQPAMMHAKTFVVDGTWSSIGSMNFDNRSMSFNDEVNLVVLDTAFGARMDAVFLDDLTYAKEVTLEYLAQRPWSEKLVEWGAEKLWRIL